MNHAVLVLDLLTYSQRKLCESIRVHIKKKKLGFLLMIFFASVKSGHVIIFFSWNRSMIFGFLSKLRADKLVLEMVMEPRVWIDLGLLGFFFLLTCTLVWDFCVAALCFTVLSPLSLFSQAKRRGRNGGWKPLPPSKDDHLPWVCSWVGHSTNLCNHGVGMQAPDEPGTDKWDPKLPVWKHLLLWEQDGLSLQEATW